MHIRNRSQKAFELVISKSSEGEKSLLAENVQKSAFYVGYNEKVYKLSKETQTVKVMGREDVNLVPDGHTWMKVLYEGSLIMSIPLEGEYVLLPSDKQVDAKLKADAEAWSENFRRWAVTIGIFLATALAIIIVGSIIWWTFLKPSEAASPVVPPVIKRSAVRKVVFKPAPPKPPVLPPKSSAPVSLPKSKAPASKRFNPLFLSMVPLALASLGGLAYSGSLPMRPLPPPAKFTAGAISKEAALKKVASMKAAPKKVAPKKVARKVAVPAVKSTPKVKLVPKAKPAQKPKPVKSGVVPAASKNSSQKSSLKLRDGIIYGVSAVAALKNFLAYKEGGALPGILKGNEVTDESITSLSSEDAYILGAGEIEEPPAKKSPPSGGLPAAIATFGIAGALQLLNGA
mmetsp:Transcript_11938/g.17797  ORF Transcript_11938/g.17797 Transcript_11938/m.17797 type:complete len:401 (+) Transcript_11938:68-1270(+)